MWQPKYISMDDIMSEASSFASGDKVRMITELYKIYSSYHDEPFDKFYFWGEMLLGDFDLIDKYMIDADMLFRNICDLKELEADLSYLTPEMRRVINSFWSHFADEASLSDEKRKFLSVWLTLAPHLPPSARAADRAAFRIHGNDIPLGRGERRKRHGRSRHERAITSS